VPNFKYTALDPTGAEKSDTLVLSSRQGVIDKLVSEGLVPVSVEEEKATEASGKRMFSAAGRVSKADVEAFTLELANLLSAGVPLSRSLGILCREAAKPAARAQWKAVRDAVADGSSLADAFSAFPRSFPPVYVAMVRAGETGGFLDLVLSQITDFQSREKKLIGKIKAATVYPAILAVMGVLILIFLMTFFIPRFSSIFQEFGEALPALTRYIVTVSHIVGSYWLIILVVVALAVIGLRRAMQNPEGRRVMERISLRIPLLGTILARFALVRFCRMLGTLVGAGVSLVTSLKVANEAIGNQTLSDALDETVKKVRNGAALSAGMVGCPQLFPPSVVEMVSVAEASGRLDKELMRLSVAYEEELDRRLSMLVAQAEPALLFIMAILVGVVIMGMLLPVFNLQELIR
jgi:type II secretory pathway component PulF